MKKQKFNPRDWLPANKDGNPQPSNHPAIKPSQPSSQTHFQEI